MPWIKYEPPTPPLELREDMKVAAQPTVGYFLLLGLSTCLATLGLIADSGAVIIGAMIIAPLMNPIIAHSFSLARSNQAIFIKSAVSIVIGIVMVLVISFSIASLVGFQLQGREILSRGNPNLIDLGVAIASGIAGAIAWSRRKIASTLPGVAIAVALVPPLCTAGIGFAMGENAIRDPNFSNLERVDNVEWGALLLFFTNFAAILVFGAVVFFIQGYGKIRPIGVLFFVPLLLISLLAFPLSRKFNQFSNKGKAARVLRELIGEFNWEDIRVSRMRVEEEDGGSMVVRLRLEAPSGVIEHADSRIMGEALSRHFERDVRVELYVSEYRLLQNVEQVPAGEAED